MRCIYNYYCCPYASYERSVMCPYMISHGDCEGPSLDVD